jgi:hypothetical protein
MNLAFRRLAGFAMLTAFVAIAACSNDDSGLTGIVPSGVAELSADITQDRILHAETTYTLTNFVHVTNNRTLTIRPGTTIKGRTGSALFIMRGAKIMAEGRADAPIVFTSDQPVGQRKPGDWGGLIIMGNGVINRAGVVELEGTGSGGAQNPAIDYGSGTNNADNSGVLRYVRVEFAGFGVAANQELNSFTFAAVGSGTQMDHLQSLAGLDDAFEWFGGAVDARHLVSYESGDDHFDAAEGYVGRNQFLIAFQDTILEPRAGSGVKSSDPQGFEIDNCGSISGSGCTLGYGSTPLTIPLFANFTLVGTGPSTQVASTSGGIGLVMRRGAAGYYVNGILSRWPRAAISLRDTATQNRFTAGNAVINNVSVIETGSTAGGNAPLFESGTDRFTIDAGASSIVAEAGTTTTTAVFAAFPATPATAADLDWSLTTGAAARTGGTGAFTGALATKAGTFVVGTQYRGAWDPSSTKWWHGWTSYARN